MNQNTGRSAVFLEEMGVGALWRLRDAVAVPAELEMAETAQAASLVAAPAPTPDAAPAPTRAASGAAPAFAAAPAPVAPAAMARPPAPAAKAADAAPDAPPPSDDAASMAWFDDAPMPAPSAPVSDAAIAALDWNGLKTAISKCTRCALSASRKGVVFGRGDREADWILVGSGPSRADERDAQALSGPAGKLLDNMLLAIGVQAEANVYVTNLVKCRPSGADDAERAPSAEESAACRPYLERELALTRGRIVLTLGQAAAAGLIRSPAAARGSVRRLGEIPVIATYHPQDMLAQPDSKARAWGDLCLAKRSHAALD